MVSELPASFALNGEIHSDFFMRVEVGQNKLPCMKPESNKSDDIIITDKNALYMKEIICLLFYTRVLTEKLTN